MNHRRKKKQIRNVTSNSPEAISNEHKAVAGSAD